MNSRDTILASLRRASPPSSPRPEYPAAIAYANPEAQFAETFTFVGGTFVRVTSLIALDAELRKLELYAKARKIVSLVPGAGESTVDLSAMKQPHELEGVDLAILPGEFGVAENGAVWVPGSSLGPRRAIFVIAEHLVLVVPASQIVHTMQHAYDRIRFERPGFGLFISGPSKTADIEQSLVIGAHGARSCTLFLVG
ncbi:MAG TPA: LUD domain-containing protein [Candidatus Saccharimonadales bacterium]|nr:LUD domain-containing protein [Candidatus Saccharimonadales bacterium]